MEPEGFFGGKVKTPSVISLVVNECTEAMSRAFFSQPDGTFKISTKDGGILTEENLLSEVCTWVRELQGGDPLQDRLVAMVRANPGWENVIAQRVIKELRRRQF